MDDQNPNTTLVDPRARQIADLVTRADQIDQQEQQEIEAVKRKYGIERLRIKALLESLMGGSSAPSATLTSSAIVRRGKPKRKWRKAADFIATHPGCTYMDLGAEMYPNEDLDQQKLKNLRALLYQMRKASVVDGEPGSWRLLKTPEEIEWMKTEDDAA